MNYKPSDELKNCGCINHLVGTGDPWITANYHSVFYSIPRKRGSREVNQALPAQIEEWLISNQTRNWAYFIRGYEDKYMLVISFQDSDDALMFKLTFANE